MKKILMAILMISLLFLSGCRNKPVLTALTSPGVTSSELISYSELETKMNAKASFILYVSSETCSSCRDFKPYLDAFIVETSVVIYQIEAFEQLPIDNSLIPFTYTPTLFFIENGEIVKTADPISEEDAFSSTEAFTTFFESYYSIE